MGRIGLRRLAGAIALAVLFPAGAAAQDWDARGTGRAVEAGSLLEGAYAGILLRCAGAGRIAVALTHNGAVFDRERDHTIVLSVDGVATMLPARAVPGERAGDDDLVHEAAAGELEPVLTALSQGTRVEVSGPSGRYLLGLAGSSNAIQRLREGCAA